MSSQKRLEKRQDRTHITSPYTPLWSSNGEEVKVLTFTQLPPRPNQTNRLTWSTPASENKAPIANVKQKHGVAVPWQN